MKWLTAQDIDIFLATKNFDIRQSGNARWIDQKCTPDVITIIADCIINFSDNSSNQFFSSVDVWHDSYTTENVENIFKKPNPDAVKARNEYDKFFQQPMEMMAYAGVLTKQKRGGRNFYAIGNRDIIEFLALREKNALLFLERYISKVLSDSGIIHLFDSFFENENKTTFTRLKDGYKDFIIAHTPINGQTEVFRIFTKVLNPLSYSKNCRGTERGRLSNHKITFDMLMYNRDNFRDVYSNKPKDVTRKEYAEQMGISENSTFTQYLSQKAKRFVRLFNDQYRGGKTEVFDLRHNLDIAIHVHHIFPEADFPEISAYYENLIVLTPTQHYNYAHPNGKTHLVDPGYQHLCLLAKAANIQENLTSTTQEHIYEFPKFMYVLDTGLNSEIFSQIEDGNYDLVIKQINCAYQA